MVAELDKGALDKRMALPMTQKELSAIPKPAAQGGIQPTNAIGIETAL